MAEIRLNIDGKEVRGRQGDTILAIAKNNNIEIPTLCFDERMNVYGACGLCVVEVEGRNGLLRACATEAANGMIVRTNSETVLSSRKTALELLVSDHVGDCLAPCTQACPGQTDCQGYVGLVANGEIEQAIELVKEKIPLPACIGRVCPHPCEEACRRELVEEPISIADIKRYMGDYDLESEDPFLPDCLPPTGKSVGVIGGGPSGLSVAYYLLQLGHAVTIYEQMPEMGGMLRYGIPEYRLPSDVIFEEVSRIQTMGGVFVNNIKIGRDRSFEDIRNSHDAIYVGVGAWKSTDLRTKGDDLDGVVGGIDFLRNVRMNQHVDLGKRVAVIGGGNTAMDACRTAVRLGAEEVSILYRRTIEEMPAETIEIEEAIEEGVDFKILVAPVELIGDENGRVSKVILQKMELGEPDASGRRRPMPIDGAIEELEVDLVIGAIGQQTALEGLEGIEVNNWGNIIADERSFQTNIPGVFAGGDVINEGASIAIKAIGDASKATTAIDGYLNGAYITYNPAFIVERKNLTKKDFADRKVIPRPHMPHLSPEERRENFEEVKLGFSPEAAKEDAMRCLACGCHDVFECKLYNYINEYDLAEEPFVPFEHNRGAKEDTSHPFIIYNPDKCILCGLCVRVCEDVMDNGALGLTKRGFETVVRPSLGQPLAETSCISCGQCVSVCPVGAFQEYQQLDKSLPLETKSTSSICTYCSVGCHITLETRGDLLHRAVPDVESIVDGGYLCVRGRFGYNQGEPSDKMTTPMVRKDGELVEVTWEEAIRRVAKKMQSVQLMAGNDATAVSISDRLTNEMLYLAKQYADNYLRTPYITSFNREIEGIEAVIGYDASTVTLEEIGTAQVSLLVGSDIYNDHTIAGLKLKESVDRGGALYIINDKKTHADNWAKAVHYTEDNQLLKEILKALLIGKGLPENATGGEALLEGLADVVISEKAEAFAENYITARGAVIIYDDKRTSVATKQLLADIAVAGGKIGRARRGLVALKDKNNSQGVVDMGIGCDHNIVAERIAKGEIKSLFVIGEEIADVDLDKLEFLAVADSFMTETAKKADVFLPLGGFAEQDGTYTSSERRIQPLNAALPSSTGIQNWEIFITLFDILGSPDSYLSLAEIIEDMCMNTPNYLGYSKINAPTLWPVNADTAYLADGFPTEDGKAHFVLPEGQSLKVPYHTTDITEHNFKKWERTYRKEK